MSHVSDSDYQLVCFESQILDRQQVFLPLKMWSYCMLILQGGAKSSVNYGRPFVTYLVQPRWTPKTPSMANKIVLYTKYKIHLLVLTSRSKSKDVFSNQDDIYFPLRSKSICRPLECCDISISHRCHDLPA